MVYRKGRCLSILLNFPLGRSLSQVCVFCICLPLLSPSIALNKAMSWLGRKPTMPNARIEGRGRTDFQKTG